MSAPDRRLTFARPDLADAALEGMVAASRFAVPETRRVIAPVVSLLPEPDIACAPDTQLLYGETVRVLETTVSWAWVQSVLDGYVGYLPATALGPDGEAPTHAVATLGAQVYAAPELKRPVEATLPFGARVSVVEETASHARIGPGLWVPRPQLRPLATPAPDWVAVAETFLGVPYVWGGRSSEGLDCSALVQLARQSGGFDCPRDSDMQEATGATLAQDGPFRRGDLVFWKRHVGIMLDEARLLHANAFHMRVVVEPLAEAVRRIAAADGGPVTRAARLDVS